MAQSLLFVCAFAVNGLHLLNQPEKIREWSGNFSFVQEKVHFKAIGHTEILPRDFLQSLRYFWASLKSSKTIDKKKLNVQF